MNAKVSGSKKVLKGLGLLSVLSLVGSSDLCSAEVSTSSSFYKAKKCESAAKDGCKGADCSSFQGFYLGAGVSWQNFKRKLTLSDNLKSVMEEKIKNFKGADKNDCCLLDKSKGVFGGTIVAGYGWQLINNWYFGVEASLDLGKQIIKCY